MISFIIGGLFGIGWIPLGGYCDIAGMIDESMDTGHLKTVEVREWMKEKGITEHYMSNEGLVRIK